MSIIKNDLVSIIVPVYNVEKYLNKCVDSIINQTYKNLEIILVDDGSTDNSGKICDEYEQKDSRIKVIHKKNGGLSSARNAGIDVTTGNYVTFIDSDDFYNNEAIEKMYSVFGNSDVDIACMFNVICYENGSSKYYECDDTNKIVYITSKNYLQLLLQRKISCSVCTKLFNAKLFKTNRFQEGRLNEDFLFNTYLFMNDYKIGIIDYCGYNYLQRANSITKDRNYSSLIDSVYNAVDIKKELIKRDMNDLIPFINKYLIYQARTVVICLSKQQYKEKSDTVNICYKIIKENKKLINKCNMPLKDKIFCHLYLFAPNLTKKAISLLRK